MMEKPLLNGLTKISAIRNYFGVQTAHQNETETTGEYTAYGGGD